MVQLFAKFTDWALFTTSNITLIIGLLLVIIIAFRVLILMYQRERSWKEYLKLVLLVMPASAFLLSFLIFYTAS